MAKKKEATKFSVIVAFTYDKYYHIGDFIFLDDDKLIKQLLTQKYIK